MAERRFHRDGQSLEPGETTLYLEAVLDGAGAVSSYTRQRGITSLSRDSAGLYTLTLQQQYFALLGLEVSFLSATEVGLRFELVSEDVNGNREIVLHFYDFNSPGTLTDPTSCTIRITLELKNVTY